VSARRLVVNADDLGRSAGINRGVVRAHTEGVVTSASLMVRYAAAPDAVAAAREHPQLGIGLHVDLGEWEFASDEWRATYDVVDTDDPDAVEEELARQLDAFHSLVGREPTHLDSHQHVHRDEPVRSAVRRAGAALGVPVRHFGPVRYCGAFYGQGRHGVPLPEGISAQALAGLIEGLTDDGPTEIACHPAEEIDFATSYGPERLVELESLCDPRARAAVETGGIELVSFTDVPA